MKLLQALKRDDTAYFLVGDDWQSINRFAGSDVGLLRNCGDYLGHVQERTLSQTFRFGDGILGPSTEFVCRNPEQTQRPLTSASRAEDKGVTVVYDDGGPAIGLQRAREDIQASARGKGSSVLVLGRYRASERRGDSSLLELVLPPAPDGAYPFAEERRLFYVAMTRARIGAYLVTNPVQPSMFVTELLRASDDLRQIGELAPKCPRCRKDRLRPMQGLRNLSCSNCKHRAPRCPNCKEGYALVARRASLCTNKACDSPAEVCPRCGVGVLRIRCKGRYGPFLGCTEYESKPSCRYTANMRTSSRH